MKISLTPVVTVTIPFYAFETAANDEPNPLGAA